MRRLKDIIIEEDPEWAAVDAPKGPTQQDEYVLPDEETDLPIALTFLERFQELMCYMDWKRAQELLGREAYQDLVALDYELKIFLEQFEDV